MKKYFLIVTAALLCTALAFQACKEDDPELDTLQTALIFAAAGETKTFDIHSNVGWSISGKPDWLTVEPMKGKDNKKVSVTAEANTGALRHATLTITAKGLSVPLPITQEGAISETISLAEIGGVTAPVSGATPVIAIANNDQYTGTVTWTPSVSGAFAYNTAYTATIILTPKAGYTLEGVVANFFTVADATATNAADGGVITAVFPATAALTVVNIAEIRGITPPVAGSAPVTAIEATEQYTGVVTWSPTATMFANSTTYTAAITLTAKAGFTLEGVPANFFAVAGATGTTNNANSGVITAAFPTTAAQGASTVSIAAIGGVTPPEAGEMPASVITETVQYTGEITWSPDAGVEFANNTAYTATITLTAKPGFTLAGVTANFFTVAGATTASNAANGGVITATFPVTDPATVSLAAIGGVTPPVAGATPVNAITETAQYTGTVTWSPAVSGTFANSATYTATITFTAKAGYTLAGVPANFFTVAGSSSVSNTANGGVITAVFPVTATPGATAINIAAIPGVTPPVTGAEPKFVITETAQYTGTVTWSPSFGKLPIGETHSFSAGTVYTATITLTPKTGFTVAGVAANFFTVAGATTVSNAANGGVITAVFPITDASKDLPGSITISPNVGVTSGTPLTASYTGGAESATVTWQWQRQFTRTIWLSINDATNATYTPTASGTYRVVANAKGFNPKASASVTVAETAVNIAAIPGVTAPVAGETPVIAILETAQYTGTVTWTPTVASTFAASTVYTATITLAAKTCLTLTVMMANYFTVAGATATNTANSGVVTAVFPQTAAPGTPDLPGTVAVNPSSATAGQTLTASYTGGGAESVTVTWQWQEYVSLSFGGLISGRWTSIRDATNATYTPTSAGQYRVRAAATGYNSKFSNSVTVTAPKSVTLTVDPGFWLIRTVAQYNITTTSIADGATGTITWYTNSTGNTIRTNPGFSIAVNNVYSDGASLRIFLTQIQLLNPPAAGTYYFRVTYDGTQSSVMSFTY